MNLQQDFEDDQENEAVARPLHKASSDSAISTRANLPKHAEKFIPATHFSGQKPGYVFSTREGLTGYFIDESLRNTSPSKTRTESPKRRKKEEKGIPMCSSCS